MGTFTIDSDVGIIGEIGEGIEVEPRIVANKGGPGRPNSDIVRLPIEY